MSSREWVSKNLFNLARLVRSTRADAALTLRQVEARCGLTNGYISQLESLSLSNPSVIALLQLSRGLGIPARDLFDAAARDHELSRGRRRDAAPLNGGSDA